jgi:SAM-dependent methyltransferase
MPSRRLPSQPDAPVHPWLARPAGRQLVADVQRQVIPELTRIFGQIGLYLRPSPEMPEELSGNMLGRVLSLHRTGDGFDGPLRCTDTQLPISGGCLSLVYALFVLESSPDPALLMQEIARALKPEGVALLVSVNPWSPARLRWPGRGGRALPPARLERFGRDAGLERVRSQHVGPYWPRLDAAIGPQGGRRWLDGFRAAHVLVLRRRDPGMTPLRAAPAAVALRPGMSAG